MAVEAGSEGGLAVAGAGDTVTNDERQRRSTQQRQGRRTTNSGTPEARRRSAEIDATRFSGLLAAQAHCCRRVSGPGLERDVGDADVVALRHRGCRVGAARSDELVEHALDDATVDRTDHRVFDDRVAEWAVLGDDLELFAIGLFGAGCEPVGGQRVGDRVEGTLERAVGCGWLE